MTFGSLSAHKRYAFVSTPKLPPVADYAPYAVPLRHAGKGRITGLTASEVRTMVQMRRGGFLWRQIAERLRFDAGGLAGIYACLPAHLQ